MQNIKHIPLVHKLLIILPRIRNKTHTGSDYSVYFLGHEIWVDNYWEHIEREERPTRYEIMDTHTLHSDTLEEALSKVIAMVRGEK